MQQENDKDEHRKIKAYEQLFTPCVEELKTNTEKEEKNVYDVSLHEDKDLFVDYEAFNQSSYFSLNDENISISEDEMNKKFQNIFVKSKESIKYKNAMNENHLRFDNNQKDFIVDVQTESRNNLHNKKIDDNNDSLIPQKTISYVKMLEYVDEIGILAILANSLWSFFLLCSAYCKRLFYFYFILFQILTCFIYIFYSCKKTGLKEGIFRSVIGWIFVICFYSMQIYYQFYPIAC